ncbi:tetratricopeptide repeat protein [Streptomyces sp. L7]
MEQARTKGDPSRYPQAQAAATRSLRGLAETTRTPWRVGPRSPPPGTSSRRALTYANKVLKEKPVQRARPVLPVSTRSSNSGRYDEASKAADHGRRPQARCPGVHPLRLRPRAARRRQDGPHRAGAGAAAATSPGDISYVAGTLGQLAWNRGDYKTALDYYGRALAADEELPPRPGEGRARAQAALGDRADAIKGLELVVSPLPLPQPLVELGELYESRGAAGDKARPTTSTPWSTPGSRPGPRHTRVQRRPRHRARRRRPRRRQVGPEGRPRRMGPPAHRAHGGRPGLGPCTSTAATQSPFVRPSGHGHRLTTTPRSSTTSA